MSPARMVTRFYVSVVAVSVLVLGSASPRAQQAAPDLSGQWTLNPTLSQFPHELGFDANFNSPGVDEQEGAPRAGRRGRGQGGSGSPRASLRPESADDAARVRQLTDEVREPPQRLTITDTADGVTWSDDHGHSRTFHPNGKEEPIQLGGVAVVTIARREAGQLVVLYEVEEGRQIRYAYSRQDNPARLIVEAQFIDRGKGDKVVRVYEPAGTTAASSASTTSPSTAATSEPPLPGAAVPAPGAEFKGLTQLGLVVEGLGPQSAGCGLTPDTLDAAIFKHLSDAGLKVRRNADEDTYVYVNINSATISNGLCVSRFDVSLTTHTTATLSYQKSPVLVEVSLMHMGSMAGGSPQAHAADVTKGVLEYVDQIAARIHDANK